MQQASLDVEILRIKKPHMFLAYLDWHDRAVITASLPFIRANVKVKMNKYYLDWHDGKGWMSRVNMNKVMKFTHIYRLTWSCGGHRIIDIGEEKYGGDNRCENSHLGFAKGLSWKNCPNRCWQILKGCGQNQRAFAGAYANLQVFFANRFNFIWSSAMLLLGGSWWVQLYT